MSDHLERVKAFLDLWHEVGQSGAIAATAALGMRREKLTDDDLRALVAEVEQLRAERAAEAIAAKFRDAVRQVNEWTARMDAHWPGWREFFEVPAAESAKAKFAAEMERLRTNDPDGAQWVEHILSERTGLSDRQANLLAAIQREGGEWAPIRARGVLVQAGYAVTKERAHQIMKQLAARGYLEQVRPRAYTYRLKTEKETS